MRKWRCTVCGYIHLGTEPPEICPVCGAGREDFVDDGPAGDEDEIDPDIWRAVDPTLRLIPYGLYVVGTRDGGRLNGCTVNSFMQVAEAPLRVVLSVTKTSLTHEYLRRQPVAAVSFLGVDGGYELARHFGLQSGRTADKFAVIPHRIAGNGCPVLENCAAFLELSLVPGAELDAGDHTVFLAAVRNGGRIREEKVLTYEGYHERKRRETT